MKKLLILTFMLIAGIFVPAYADTMNYIIKQNGSEMVIIPQGSMCPQPVMQKSIYKIEVHPTKMPFYAGKKLPRGKNKICFA